MSKCKSNWIWNQCNFVPIYDEVPTGLMPDKIHNADLEKVRELLVRRVYVRSVCTSCGEVIERADKGVK